MTCRHPRWRSESCADGEIDHRATGQREGYYEYYEYHGQLKGYCEYYGSYGQGYLVV